MKLIVSFAIFVSYILCFARRGTIHGRVLRNSNKLALPKFRTVRYQQSPLLYMTKLYNDHSS